MPILFAGPGANGAQLITDFSTFPVTYGGSGNGVVPTVRLQVTDTGATSGPYTGVMNLQQCLANATTMASRLYMNANGQFGLGTITPAHVIDAVGNIRASGTLLAPAAVVDTATSNNLTIINYANVNGALTATSASVAGAVSAAGNATFNLMSVSGQPAGFTGFKVFNQNVVAANTYALYQSNTGYTVVNGKSSLAFATNDSTTATVTATGLGIYTTNPSYVLDVGGTGRMTGSILQGTSTDTSRAISCLNSAMATGGTSFITVGQSATTNNQAELAFQYAGSGSGNNAASLGVYGIQVLTCNGRGNVGINNSSPAYNLDVSGNARISGGLFLNNLTQNQILTLYNNDATLNSAGTNFAGFGVNANTLRYQTPPNNFHTWYTGNSQTLNMSSSSMAYAGTQISLGGTASNNSSFFSQCGSGGASYIGLDTSVYGACIGVSQGAQTLGFCVGVGQGNYGSATQRMTLSSTTLTMTGDIRATGNIKTSGFSYDQPLSATYYTNTNLTLSATTPANFPASTWSGYSTNAQTGSITFSNAGDITITSNGVWSISFSTTFSISAADNRVWLVNRNLSGGVLNPNQDQLAGIMGGPLGYATATWTGYFAANTLVTPVMYSNVSQSVGGTSQARLNITRVTVCN